MEGKLENRPEWFVSKGMGFQGPLTTEQVQEQLKQAEIGRENLIWADGMADWQRLSEVRIFEGFIEDAVPFVQESPLMDGGERDFSSVLNSVQESGKNEGIWPRIKARFSNLFRR